MDRDYNSIRPRVMAEARSFAKSGGPRRVSGLDLRLGFRCVRLSRVRLSRSGHGNSQLLHQRHQVPVRPYLRDLRTLDAVDGGAGDGGFFVSGRHPEELALVGAGGCPVFHNLVPFGDGVVVREHQVGEAVATCLDVVLDVLRSRAERREHRVVVTAVVCDEFRDGVEVSLVPTLVHEPLYDLLVVCGLRVLWRHGESPFLWPGIIGRFDRRLRRKTPAQHERLPWPEKTAGEIGHRDYALKRLRIKMRRANRRGECVLLQRALAERPDGTGECRVSGFRSHENGPP
jgi:hypothetical protein